MKVKTAYILWSAIRYTPRIIASLLALGIGAAEILFCYRAFAGGWIPFWGNVKGEDGLGCCWLFIGGPLFLTVAYWVYMIAVMIIAVPCEFLCNMIRRRFDPDYDPEEQVSDIFD